MCRQLDELCESVVDYARRFDVQALTPAQAGTVVERCARMEGSIAAVRTLAASRNAEGESWKKEGYRSPAVEQLDRKTGTSPTAARRALETGRWLREQPEVADAALGGALSAAQTEAVCDGVATDASKAAELIERAKTSSVIGLNDEVAKLETAAVDAEGAHRRLHAKRSLRPWTDREGAFHATSRGTPPMAPACGGLSTRYAGASTVCAAGTASSSNGSRRSTTTP